MAGEHNFYKHTFQDGNGWEGMNNIGITIVPKLISITIHSQMHRWDSFILVGEHPLEINSSKG